MKIGLLGLPQSGKKTLFRLLTGAENVSVNLGVCKIKDFRLDNIAKIYNSEKITCAEIEYQLIPAIIPGHESLKDSINILKNLDALCLVIRDFKDETIYHINESVDPSRDINNIFQELTLADLMLVETRLERIKDAEKRNNIPALEKEKLLLLKIKTQLENEIPIRNINLNEEEQKALRSLQFVTMKNVLIVLNTNDLNLGETLPAEIKKHEAKNTLILPIAVKTEEEINSLEESEREEFLKELGIKEHAIHLMTRLSAQLLNLIIFFTAGKNEARAWLIPKGLSAPQTAGKIHSDLERGFIRAEVIKLKDLEELGSEQAVKEAGKWSLKGKGYIIEEGDIVLFRFNV